MKTLMTLAVVSSSVLYFVGCGVDADDQNGRDLEYPTSPKDTHAFFLDGGEYDKTFSGSMIVWQDDANIDGIAGVAEVSDKIIDNGVATLNYIKNDISPLKADFNNLYGDAKAKTIAYQEKSYGIAARAAATWLAGEDGMSGQLAAIAGEYYQTFGEQLPPQSFLQTQGWAAAYCEAKLWERAINDNLIFEEYRGRRPTPSAMCEGVYQKLGLISTETEKCRASGEFKNFFGCLWHEGVKKTTLWKSRYPTGSDAGDKFAAASDETLMYNFAEERLANDLLQQRRTGKIVDPKTEEETRVDLKFVAGPTGPASLSAQKIIRNIEFRPTSGDQYRLIPVGEAEGDAAEFIEAKNDWLREQLTFFNKLSLGGYINENRFNRIFQKDSETKGDIAWTEEQKVEAAQKFPSVFVISNPELDALQSKLATAQTKVLDNAQKAKLALGPVAPRQDCPKLPKDHDPTKPLEGSYSCVYQHLSVQGTKVAAPKDVSKAVWQGEIRLRRDAEQRTLEVWVTANKVGGITHYGCTNLTDEKICDAKKMRKDFGYGAATVVIDDETGYFDIKANIVDASESGLTMRDRADLETQLTFSEVPENLIVGNNLAFYVTLNTIDDVLTTFLGDASLQTPDGEVIYGASVKMRDQAPYYKTLADEYKTALLQLAGQQ